MKHLRQTILFIFLLIACSVSYAQGNMGIDVSHHQGTVDWKMVAKDRRIGFVYIKATEGATYTDKKLFENANAAHKEGLSVGVYHFFRMTSSPEKQFKHFKKQTKNLHIDLIPMVDVETTDGYPKKEVQRKLKVFLDLLEKEYGKKPMIYGTMRSYNSICAPVFNKYHLYIGRYGKSEPVITGTGTYTIWQYTETAKIKGCDKTIDLCRFHPKYSIKDILL